MYNNPVLECIATRKSIRKYTDQKVSDEVIELLLRAAMAAPSAKNAQSWEFVVVRERCKLDELASKLKYAKMLAQAPLAVVVCSRIGSEFPAWQQDASAATQNLLLAAHSMGLGAVWTAAYDQERAAVVTAELTLPEDVKPLSVVAIGYPAEEKLPKDKWHPEKIHFEKW